MIEYSLLAPGEVTQGLTFLPEDIVSNVRKNRGWVMVGQENSQGPVLTIAAFLQMADKKSVELVYIFTRPEEREEGCALGLLEAAGRIFIQNGIERIVCMPIGPREQIRDFTHFLLLCDFVPLMQDGHIYTYNKQQLLSSGTLKPYLERSVKKYTSLSQGEMRYYARSMDKELPTGFRAELLRGADTEKSVFAIHNDRIYGGILLSISDTEKKRAELLNIYVNPRWEHPQEILCMLTQVIKEMSADNVGIDIAMDDDRVRRLFSYVLGEPQTDCWVQRYEKDIMKED